MVRCATVLGSDSCDDCGWVDYVQSPMPSDWNSISYVGMELGTATGFRVDRG
jgi:hypothetical protein